MATVTITIPDTQMDDVGAAAGTTLADPPKGTAVAVVDAAVRAWLASLYAQHMQRKAAIEDPAAAAAIAAEAAAKQARNDAFAAREAAQTAARATALANVSLWT